MYRTLLTFVLAIVAVQLLSASQEASHERVKVLSQRDIEEKLADKPAKATIVEVTLAPGEASPPHHHPGPAFGYVLEGEYDWAINDAPVKTLKAGDTFYEPTGCLHRVSKNSSQKAKARVLAVVLHPADVKQIVIPQHGK